MGSLRGKGIIGLVSYGVSGGISNALGMVVMMFMLMMMSMMTMVIQGAGKGSARLVPRGSLKGR